MGTVGGKVDGNHVARGESSDLLGFAAVHGHFGDAAQRGIGGAAMGKGEIEARAIGSDERFWLAIMRELRVIGDLRRWRRPE